jgi:hypothetical protein
MTPRLPLAVLLAVVGLLLLVFTHGVLFIVGVVLLVLAVVALIAMPSCRLGSCSGGQLIPAARFTAGRCGCRLAP